MIILPSSASWKSCYNGMRIHKVIIVTLDKNSKEEQSLWKTE